MSGRCNSSVFLCRNSKGGEAVPALFEKVNEINKRALGQDVTVSITVNRFSDLKKKHKNDNKLPLKRHGQLF